MRTDDALQPEASFHPDAVATVALIVNPVPALFTPAIHAAVQVQERPPALARLQSILRI